jgi:hypothetical protein
MRHCQNQNQNLFVIAQSATKLGIIVISNGYLSNIQVVVIKKVSLELGGIVNPKCQSHIRLRII